MLVLLFHVHIEVHLFFTAPSELFLALHLCPAFGFHLAFLFPEVDDFLVTDAPRLLELTKTFLDAPELSEGREARGVVTFDADVVSTRVIRTVEGV